MSLSETPAAKQERSALISGIAAFGFWGVIPIYWKFMASVPAPQIWRIASSGPPSSSSHC
jgi:EamA domain-containing membrane protein RarD